MKIRKTVTEAKAKANDYIAKTCATGPRTQTGKEFSRRNALKHGIFSGMLGILEQEAGAEGGREKVSAARPPKSS